MTTARRIARGLLLVLAAGGTAPALRAQAGGGPPAAPSGPASSRPGVYGSGVESLYVLDASELSPNDSITEYRVDANLRRWVLSDTTLGFIARPHLPIGALLTSVHLDFYDTSAAGEAAVDLLVCDPYGAGCTLLSGGCFDHPGTVCSGDAFDGGEGNEVYEVGQFGVVVDDFLRRILIQAGNSTHDGSTAISRISIGYVLQVSPAPPNATFSDVPTSHPFFQFIEALAASGITGGCGGGKFCPEAPLTRGQMAVFLAKALGLQFN